MIPYIQELGIVVQGWYPLGGRGYTAELLGNEVISDIAKAHGKSSAQIILRWNLQKGVVVIPGSSNPDHIQENTGMIGIERKTVKHRKAPHLKVHQKIHNACIYLDFFSFLHIHPLQPLFLH